MSLVNTIKCLAALDDKQSCKSNKGIYIRIVFKTYLDHFSAEKGRGRDKIKIHMTITEKNKNQSVMRLFP
mgnify:CR=1 FL=1